MRGEWRKKRGDSVLEQGMSSWDEEEEMMLEGKINSGGGWKEEERPNVD